jgi:hypothetical protein
MAIFEVGKIKKTRLLASLEAIYIYMCVCVCVCVCVCEANIDFTLFSLNPSLAAIGTSWPLAARSAREGKCGGLKKKIKEEEEQLTYIS